MLRRAAPAATAAIVSDIAMILCLLSGLPQLSIGSRQCWFIPVFGGPSSTSPLNDTLTEKGFHFLRFIFGNQKRQTIQDENQTTGHGLAAIKLDETETWRGRFLLTCHSHS